VATVLAVALVATGAAGLAGPETAVPLVRAVTGAVREATAAVAADPVPRVAAADAAVTAEPAVALTATAGDIAAGRTAAAAMATRDRAVQGSAAARAAVTSAVPEDPTVAGRAVGVSAALTGNPALPAADHPVGQPRVLTVAAAVADR
jgi:hypothetical protein